MFVTEATREYGSWLLSGLLGFVIAFGGVVANVVSGQSLQIFEYLITSLAWKVGGFFLLPFVINFLHYHLLFVEMFDQVTVFSMKGFVLF